MKAASTSKRRNARSARESARPTPSISIRQPEKMEIKVGAIVLSPGFEPFDPKLREDYGYGKYENVVTSLDYERLLCATGPYEGEIRRATDKKHPHKIAWIHCVGSRQVIPGGKSYCSAVCCTYTQKQVILTKDHDADAECTIFHNDIRSYGKDFERFYQRAEKLPGIRFIRSYVSVGKEIPGSKNVTIRYSTPDDGVKEEEFDMVVLSVGLNPPADFKSLAAKFGIELNAHGFCKTNPVNPMETTRPGIFISGAFQGPIDIPESVVTASGAGSQCGELLGYRRGKLAKAKSVSAGKGCLERRAQSRRLCVPLRREYRKSGGCSFRRGVRVEPAQCRSCGGKPVSYARPTPRSDWQLQSGKRGSTAWSSPPARQGRTNRCSGTRFAKRASISTSTTWRISGSIAPGSTPRKRKTPRRRPKTSSGWRWPAPRIWSPCRNLICRSTRRRWWSAAAWPE